MTDEVVKAMHEVANAVAMLLSESDRNPIEYTRIQRERGKLLLGALIWPGRANWLLQTEVHREWINALYTDELLVEYLTLIGATDADDRGPYAYD